MDFKTLFLGLTSSQRQEFASAVGSTVGYLQQIVYGHKQIELGLADAMVAASGGRLSLEDLPLTDRAKFQNRARRCFSAYAGPLKPPVIVTPTYSGPDRRAQPLAGEGV